MLGGSNGDDRQYTKAIILTITFISGVICFIPTFIVPNRQPSSNVASAADYVGDDYLTTWSQSIVSREASLNCFVITIVPAIDLLMEWMNDSARWRFLRLFSKDKNKSTPPNSNGGAMVDADLNSIRMTLVERTIFIIGIILTGGCLSFPAVYESPDMDVIYYSFTDISTILTITPLIIFLSRVSPTCTPVKAVAVCVFACGCPVLHAISTILQNVDDVINLNLAFPISMIIATGLFFLIAVQAIFAKWTRWQQRQQRGIDHPMESKSILNDGFRMSVILMYVCVLLSLLIVNSAWYYLPPLSVQGIASYTYTYIGIATLVFILELRVRKVEFQSALIALLDTKKSYVRYISHGEWCSI